MSKEEWRAIKGFSQYQVSNLGRVKSLSHAYTRVDGVSGIRKEKILSTKRTNKLAYINVVLKADDGITHNLVIHKLVAEAFLLRDTPDKNVVNHKDGNKHNNIVTNLEWVTTGENNRHAYRNGLKQCTTRKKCRMIKPSGAISEYNSIKAMGIAEGIPVGTLSSALCTGTRLRDGSRLEYI